MTRIFNVLAIIIILAGCAGSGRKPPETFIPPVFQAQPEIIMLETVPEVYYVKGYVNIFFYSNWWYCYANEAWYASLSYNGPWRFIETYQLPGRFGQIPPGHLRTAPEPVKSKPDKDTNLPPGISDGYDDDK